MAVSAGASHTCAITNDGNVKCWGYNDTGQLGNGSQVSSSKPVNVVGLDSKIIAVSAGGGHTCALTKDGAVKCWGENRNGELGIGGLNPYISTSPLNVVGLDKDVVAISAGRYHTCAVTKLGSVKCWGINVSYQLGDGTNTNSPVPVTVAGLGSDGVSVSAGYYQSCALTKAKTMQCWGKNEFAEVGDGTATLRTKPVDVVSLQANINMLSTGFGNTCTVASGFVHCWGDKAFGGLQNIPNFRGRPLPLGNFPSKAAAITSGRAHTCAVTLEGKALCWGINDHGQLGNASQPSTPNSYFAFSVLGLLGKVISITAGGDHTCAISEPGTLQCWGKNDNGQLGNGSKSDSVNPIEVK